MDLKLKTLQPEYESAFSSCSIRKEVEPEVKQITDRMLELRSHYETVEKATGIPWWFSGILHYREWNFREPDLFTKKVIDILLAKNYHQARTRTLGSYLWGLDLWNGFKDGAGDESKWIWTGTSVLDSGLKQIGAAAILVYLQTHDKIDIPKPGEGIRLKVLADTVFKARPDQSFRLKEDEKINVPAGTRLEILEDDPADNEHAKLTIPDGVLMGQNDRLEWYVFKQHISLEGNQRDNKPNDPPEEPVVKIGSEHKGNPMTLPKLGVVYLGDTIIPGGHFSWAEATKNGSRMPANEGVVDGIIKVAKVMEEVREYLGGRSITINSWYRDPASNRRAGGASKSRHMSGDAVDFVVQGIKPPQVNRQLESWWGSRGGLASASCFTHIDARGYRARWSYGF